MAAIVPQIESGEKPSLRQTARRRFGIKQVFELFLGSPAIPEGQNPSQQE